MKRRDPSFAFLWLVYGFVTVVWFIAVLEPSFQQGPWLIPFTLLAALHVWLHASLLRVGKQGVRVRGGYMAVQVACALGLVLMAPHSMLTPSLFFPLAGEAFGLFPDLPGRLLSVGGVILAWGVTAWISGPRSEYRIYVPGALIAFVFVGIYVTLYARQTVERDRAERLASELEQANRRLRSYARRVEELTIAEERQRMARELHDTLAQGLAGLVLQLEAVDDLLSRQQTERARTITGRAMQRARSTLAEARTAISALRTPLEQGNVVGAIADLVESLRKEAGIECVFEVGPGDLSLSGGAGEHLYRVARECLTNIQRHAHASQVAVRLAATASEVRLEVADNGVGFDPCAVAKGHFGLLGMRERIQLAGGTLEVTSRPGAGTQVVTSLPTAPDEEED